MQVTAVLIRWTMHAIALRWESFGHVESGGFASAALSNLFS
jgi:hypothetical protein